MKNLIVLVTILFLNQLVFAQLGLGCIKLSAFSNNDNNLRHNIELDSIYLLITTRRGKDTIINGNVKLPVVFEGSSPGNYSIIGTTENYPSIESHFTVSNDKITFLTLLFEPKKKKRKYIMTGI